MAIGLTHVQVEKKRRVKKRKGVNVTLKTREHEEYKCCMLDTRAQDMCGYRTDTCTSREKEKS